MQARLIIRLHKNGDARWVSVDEHGKTTDPRTGLPSVSDCSGKQVVVLVPGERVLSTEVSVPTRNRAHMLKALPFAVEEQLAFDIESQHVAAGKPTDKPGVSVNVVARADIESWLIRLSDAGLKPDVMLADYMALAERNDQSVMLLEEERAVVRIGGTGFVCAREHLARFWAALESAPANVRVYDVRTRPDDNVKLPATAIDYQRGKEQPFELFANAPDARAINLLQGEFSTQQGKGVNRTLWRVAAGAAAIWLVLLSVFAVTDYFMLRAQAAELQQQIAGDFETLLPNARLVNARAQIEQALAARGAGSPGFVALLSRLAPVLERHATISLQALQYREETLTLRLGAPNIAALDALRRALAANTAFEVELESATATGGGVDGRLSISRRSG